MRPVQTESGRPLLVSVVLNWRKPDMTAECVDSLKASTYGNHRIVIVDNGSGDYSIDSLKSRFPGLCLIESPDNVGFSRGCNLGIRWALDEGADYVALVNNDMTLQPPSYDAAIDYLEHHPEFGAVTGKIYSADPAVIWQAGGRISHLRVMGQPRAHFELDQGQYDACVETGWASGAMSAFRAEALRSVDLLPEEYFFGQEEWDVSTDLRRHGHRIAYVPSYVGHHSNGSSYSPHPALNSYGATRNRLLYAEKYLSPLARRIWRMALTVHIRFVMGSRMRLRGTHQDVGLHVKAMGLALRRHRHATPVTLDELVSVSHDLGIPSSWDPEPAPGSI